MFEARNPCSWAIWRSEKPANRCSNAFRTCVGSPSNRDGTDTASDVSNPSRLRGASAGRTAVNCGEADRSTRAVPVSILVTRPISCASCSNMRLDGGTDGRSQGWGVRSIAAPRRTRSFLGSRQCRSPHADRLRVPGVSPLGHHEFSDEQIASIPRLSRRMVEGSSISGWEDSLTTTVRDGW